jgi:HD-like signal output (HDOD) protein
MLVAGIAIGALVGAALGAWGALRRRRIPAIAAAAKAKAVVAKAVAAKAAAKAVAAKAAAKAAVAARPIEIPAGSKAAPQIHPIDTLRVQAVNAVASERLWRLAFAVPAPAPSQQPLPPEHARVQESIIAVLRADKLDPKYFPRRPTLMPQLLRAVNDPDAAPDTVSRIIAQDPVLTGDVLRLANSNFYRVTPEPVETIQRAVVICGLDGLQSLLAAALLQPVFRATDKNFPRFPLLLWERTERTARAAELYAARTRPQDRFEAQLVALLSALGPLVVYRATIDAYSRSPGLAPSPALCVALIGTLGQQMSQRIAGHWQSSPRLVAALGPPGEDAVSDRSLAHALFCGELLGTLSLLESQQDISPRERLRLAEDAGLPDDLTTSIWERLGGTGK